VKNEALQKLWLFDVQVGRSRVFDDQIGVPAQLAPVRKSSGALESRAGRFVKWRCVVVRSIRPSRA
jgi:hypothetical protein